MREVGNWCNVMWESTWYSFDSTLDRACTPFTVHYHLQDHCLHLSYLHKRCMITTHPPTHPWDCLSAVIESILVETILETEDGVWCYMMFHSGSSSWLASDFFSIQNCNLGMWFLDPAGTLPFKIATLVFDSWTLQAHFHSRLQLGYVIPGHWRQRKFVDDNVQTSNKSKNWKGEKETHLSSSSSSSHGANTLCWNVRSCTERERERASLECRSLPSSITDSNSCSSSSFCRLIFESAADC